jgi:hypothetical protein
VRAPTLSADSAIGLFEMAERKSERAGKPQRLRINDIIYPSSVLFSLYLAEEEYIKIGEKFMVKLFFWFFFQIAKTLQK